VLGALALAAGLVAGTPRAFAIDEEVQLTTAEQACLSGNYQRGVEILANLYLATRKPAYLHNQARCYEQNGQNEAAIGRYNEFLRQAKGLPIEKKAELEANIIRLEQKVARQRAVQGQMPSQGPAQAPYYGQQPPVYAPPTAPAASPGPTPDVLPPGAYPSYPTPTGATRAPVVAPPAGARASVPDVAAAASSGGNKGLRIAGIVSAATGAGALVVATLSGLSAKDAEKKTEEDTRAMRVYDDKRYQSGTDAAKLSTIGFIAAPVLLGAGAVMYWLGIPSAPEKAALTVTPQVARRGAAGLSVTGVNLSLTY
jgi:hypothetical protein